MKNLNLAVCTGLAAEHLDTYGSFEGVKDGFTKFLNDSMRKDDATAIVYTDSQGVRDIYPKIKCRKISYGFDCGTDYRAINDEYKNGILSFTALKKLKRIRKDFAETYRKTQRFERFGCGSRSSGVGNFF